MEGRPLVASAATGSLSSVLLWLLHEALQGGQREVLPAAPPPVLELDLPASVSFSGPDFWLGILIGFLLWPLLEILVLTKQWITLCLRNRIAGAAAGSAKLYKVL